MSKEAIGYTGVYKGDYHYYSPIVHVLVAGDEDLSAKVDEIDALYDTFLFMHDVQLPGELPQSARDYLKNIPKPEFKFGDKDHDE